MNKEKSVILLVALLISTVAISLFVVAVPTGPDSINFTANETKAATSAHKVNISGGNISKLNITATTKNPHWKGFVGWITGVFTLDDASGSTLFDWTLSSVTGEVYATRASGTVNWSGIECSNLTLTEWEGTNMSHSNIQDNITATFDDSTHSTFVVSGTQISANSCPTLNTYVNNASQDASFEEVVLFDHSATNNTIYATILEEDVTGYDGAAYDFQMIVPENANETLGLTTAYYIYVELS